MNERKIGFISCVSDPLKYREALSYIRSLAVPDGYEIEFRWLENTDGITSGYNQMMKSSDAKYKVYLHQDVFIMNRNFLQDILALFHKFPRLGMIGAAGTKTIPSNGIWWEGIAKYGKVYDSHTGQMGLLSFGEVKSDYESVRAIDGFIMATQFDLPWREDLLKGWHFYDLSQSLEFISAGYEVGVPKQVRPWHIHDCRIVNTRNGFEENRQIFIRHYGNWLESESEKKWIRHNPQFQYETYHPSIVKNSAWIGHRRFAYDLVRFMQPKVVVELGTHWGASYFSFAQAVKDGGMPSMCFAIDTWNGDAHTGLYQDEVYRIVCGVVDQYYHEFTSLLRFTFDEAADRFEGGSIDLLHIDGYHTYEAVLHDYETWLPKLADQGVILLHDIAVKIGDFGVHQLWEELKSQHPFIEFRHSGGLGVLFPKGCSDGVDQVILFKEVLQDIYKDTI